MIFNSDCAFFPGGGSGALPLGSGPFGSSTPDGFAIVSVDVRTPNQLRVQLAGVGEVGSRFEPGTILDPRSWSIEALDPDAVPRLVQTVELVSDSPNPVVDVFTDMTLTSDRQYRLALSTGAVAISGCDEVDFEAIRPQVSETTRGVQLARDGFNDIANPNLRGDAVTLGALSLGTYVITADGDLKQDSGLVGLRKRVIRRATTALSGFFHLPDYGVDLELKRLIRADTAVRIQAKLRAQILQEPGVLQAQVQVTNPQTAPNLLGIIIRVQAESGDTLGVGLQLTPEGTLV